MKLTRVLLIDDSEDFYILTKRLLERAQHTYIYDWVSNFEEGMEVISQDNYDVYLLDRHIGHRNGIELLDYAVRNGLTAPCIMVSARVSAEDEASALQQGAIDYIEKEFPSPELLEKTIIRALNRVRFRNRLIERHQQVPMDADQFREALESRDRYIEQLTILRQVDDELSQITSIEAVLDLAMDAALRLSAARAGFIALLQGNNRLQVVSIIGETPTLNLGDVLETVPLFEDIMQHGESRLMDDPAQMVAANPHTRMQMLLPIISNERCLGILNVETDRPERFTEGTFEFIKLIASRVGVAVDNALLYHVSQDQLTELQTLYNQVSLLEQLKSDMIRMAAHDLSNPISVIRGYVKLLQRIEIPEKREDYFKMVDLSLKQMTRIITDILSLERIEKMQDGDWDDINLRELTMDVLPAFEPQAELQGIAITTYFNNGDPVICADDVQIREAMSNMISNAIKYTPENGYVSISIAQENGKAIFIVEDSGYGIPRDQQHKLFQPFSRIKSNETASIDGTGLGLYLIKRIIERFGGNLIFSSEHGKGSRFGFRLPAVGAEGKPEMKFEDN